MGDVGPIGKGRKRLVVAIGLVESPLNRARLARALEIVDRIDPDNVVHEAALRTLSDLYGEDGEYERVSQSPQDHPREENPAAPSPD